MVSAEQLVGEEWAEWYRLTPAERWAESEKLWAGCLMLAGSLGPECSRLPASPSRPEG